MEESTYDIATDSGPEEDFRSCTYRIVTEKFESIIEAMAQKSIEGSLPHTKYLFELGGVKEEIRQIVQNNGEPSLRDLIVAVVNKHEGAGRSTAEGSVEAHGAAESKPCDDPALPVSDCGVKEQ